jgi:hypothetical protein
LIAIQPPVPDSAGSLQQSRYETVSDALAALTSDGKGGALLPLPYTLGSVDFVGVSPSAITANNLSISESWLGGHT